MLPSARVQQLCKRACLHAREVHACAHGANICGAAAPSFTGSTPRVAAIGDTVTLHFTCRDSEGQVRACAREWGCVH